MCSRGGAWWDSWYKAAKDKVFTLFKLTLLHNDAVEEKINSTTSAHASNIFSISVHMRVILSVESEIVNMLPVFTQMYCATVMLSPVGQCGPPHCSQVLIYREYFNEFDAFAALSFTTAGVSSPAANRTQILSMTQHG
jgi:hypothetical protein